MDISCVLDRKGSLKAASLDPSEREVCKIYSETNVERLQQVVGYEESFNERISTYHYDK